MAQGSEDRTPGKDGDMGWRVGAAHVENAEEHLMARGPNQLPDVVQSL